MIRRKMLALLSLVPAFIFTEALLLQPGEFRRAAKLLPATNRRHDVILMATTSSLSEKTAASTTTTAAMKDDLLNVVNRIKEDQGTFIYDSTAKSELESAVSALENAAINPITEEDCNKYFQGDWILFATTASDKDGIDTSKLPFFQNGPLNDLRRSVNQNVRIIQKIRSSTSEVVDRVDNIIEINPPKSLDTVFDNLPDFLRDAPIINPLEVTKSQTILVHKAEIESYVPKLKTKLTLQSIVLNVAGESQFLEPNGADVLGLNVPGSEFLNNAAPGSFETTYLDENLRISRGKANGSSGSNQLRVFMRDPTSPLPEYTTSSQKEEEAVDVVISDGVSTDASGDIEKDEVGQKEGSAFDDVEWIEEEEEEDASQQSDEEEDVSPSDS